MVSCNLFIQPGKFELSFYVAAPVSFSIKKPKEHEVPKEIKSALPVEESDEEVDDKNEPQNAVQDQEQQQQQLVEKESPKSELKNGIMDVDDPILEMIDLTDDAEEKRDAKRGIFFTFNNFKDGALNLIISS